MLTLNSETSRKNDDSQFGKLQSWALTYGPDFGTQGMLLMRRWITIMSLRHNVSTDWLHAHLEPVSCISSFILQELLAYSHHMRPGIVRHQEEPRVHSTSVESDKQEDKQHGYASLDLHISTKKLVMRTVLQTA